MLFLLPLFTLALTALAAPLTTPNPPALARRALSGQATSYGGNLHGGTCSFSTYNLPKGIYGTALSDANWASSSNCGGCVHVSHAGKTITAMIVDQCPGCGTNHLDLFSDAFKALDNPTKGTIDVEWRYVKCPRIQGPLQIHLKSGVSKYWFSAQVVNGSRRTRRMEVSTDQGRTWKGTVRKEYNFFEIGSGVGVGEAWVRVTSFSGSRVVVQNVPMMGDAVKAASKNYA